MATPLVSVLMTVYNREKYLGAAIESVLASTWQDFELVITDDCSTDRSVEIAQHYAALDSRIKLHVNERNLGDYPNRNQAASHAVGKYLKYVDADDLIYPWGLELLVRLMEEYPEAGYGLCSLEQDEFKPFPFLLSPQEAYRRHYFVTPLFHKAPLSAIIKKNIFVEIGGFKSVRHIGDNDLWHRLSMKYPVLLIQAGIVWWRKHDEQENKRTRTSNIVPLQHMLLGLNMLKSDECPLGSGKLSVIAKQERHISRYLIKTYMRSGFRAGRECKKIAQISYFDMIIKAFF